MPMWGLTHEQRGLRPWGLSPELLAPCKTITDPVHGDIYLTRLEVLILDSPPMQRLRRVRQLGMTHLVYPGATHSRWSHSEGTLRAAQNLLDAIWNSRNSPHSDHELGNLIEEWADAGCLDIEFGKATVLARLGALMHDLCHVPMGHTVEDDLRILDPHDGNVARFERLWLQVDQVAREAIEQAPDLRDELRILIISKDEHARKFPSQYPFVGDIVGNTICADLMDYLARDHYNCGLPLSLGDRFMDNFFVVSSTHPHYAKKMVISIQREGRRRADVVTELVKYLRYRYELTERVLTHHAKTAADAMLGKMIELWNDDLIQEHDDSVPGEDRVVGSLRLTAVSPDPSSEATGEAKKRLEDEFLKRSDDGILEHIVDRGASRGTSRAQAAAELASDLMNRKLFKIIGHAGNTEDHAIAEEVWAKFAEDPRTRRALENAAAKFAGIEDGWKIVVWLPSPKMRLKVAEVLVYTRDKYVAPLSRVESASEEIVKQHRNLWAATVYAPEEVADEQAEAALAFLGDAMGIRFGRPSGALVGSEADTRADALIRKFPSLAKHRSVLREQALAASDSTPTDGTDIPSPTTRTFAGSVQALENYARENDLFA